MKDDWSDEQTNDPLVADVRNYKIEKWTRDGMNVDSLLYAGNNLDNATGVRHAKLMIACGCKSHPVKAVAGRPGSSLAGVAATRGLKCRQRPCGVWDRTSKV